MDHLKKLQLGEFMKKYIVKYQYKNDNTIFRSWRMTLEQARDFVKDEIAFSKNRLKAIAIYEIIKPVEKQ